MANNKLTSSFQINNHFQTKKPIQPKQEQQTELQCDHEYDDDEDNDDEDDDDEDDEDDDLWKPPNSNHKNSRNNENKKHRSPTKPPKVEPVADGHQSISWRDVCS